MSRTIVIGDIHGYRPKLDQILEQINPTKDDKIITLGDYIDRGPDSCGVIERLIELQGQCHLVPLMGNHELMIMRSCGSKEEFEHWLLHGGIMALESYDKDYASKIFTHQDIKKVIPYKHMAFIMSCSAYHEDDNNIYVHANYDSSAPINEQREETTFWTHLNDHTIPEPHPSKTIWVGHTPQKSHKILDLGHIVCVDTGVFRNGPLTAVDVNTREIWQSDC